MQDDVASLISEVFEAIVDRKYPRLDEVPVLINVDFGHISPVPTLPVGALARLGSEFNEFTMLEPVQA
jgi:muramoyltetrapeptide carboxypeptidase LdcA involved in peptidoglycan recycling